MTAVGATIIITAAMAAAAVTAATAAGRRQEPAGSRTDRLVVTEEVVARAGVEGDMVPRCGGGKKQRAEAVEGGGERAAR